MFTRGYDPITWLRWSSMATSRFPWPWPSPSPILNGRSSWGTDGALAPKVNHHFDLVGGWPIPLKKHGLKVSWDDDIPNWMESQNPVMFQTTNQDRINMDKLTHVWLGKYVHLSPTWSYPQSKLSFAVSFALTSLIYPDLPRLGDFPGGCKAAAKCLNHLYKP